MKLFKRIFALLFAPFLLITLYFAVKDSYLDMPKGSVPVFVDKGLSRYSEGREASCIPTESYLSGKLAVFNDIFIKNGTKYYTRLPATALGSRILAVTLFPLSVAVDSVYAGGMYAYHECIKESSSAKLYLMRIRKDLLGLVATPVSLLSPDLVTNHFIPVGKKPSLIRPYGKLYSCQAIQVYPKSSEEVQDILLLAKKLKKRVTVAGKLYSQGKVSLPIDHTDILMHLGGLNQIEIDPVNKVARCGAGATWKEIQNAADEHLLAVRVMQASNIFSLGGSLSINCHGWDHKSGSLSETVLSMTVITSDGKKVVVHPGDELFHLVLGGVGMFGVIIEAEISLTDNSHLVYQGIEVQPENYVAYFDTIKTDPDVELHYYRLSLEPGKLFEEGIAANYLKAGSPVKSVLLDEHPKGSTIDRIKLQTIRRLKWLHQIGWSEEKKAALVTWDLTRNEAMRPPILAITSESDLDVEWLQEYFVKPEHLTPFLKSLASLLNQNQVPVFNASVRYIGKNSSQSFNYSPDGDRFAIVIFFNQSLKPDAIQKTKSWILEAVNLLHKYEGSYYLPYQAFPTVEQFRSSYPNWETVRNLKRKWDPDHRFVSGFFTDYMEALPAIYHPSPFKALLNPQDGMRPQILAFLTDIFMRLDGERFFTLCDDILKNPALTDEEIYPLLLPRISEAKMGLIKNLKLTYQSLQELKEELSNQVQSLLGDQTFHNYVEIGYPGRMIKPLKQKLKLDGKMTVIHTDQSLQDYLQSGFPSPVDQFVPLNDFEPINAEKIPSSSVDLVSLFIGLHHIPEEKVVPFLRSIHRILRPGGSFILMDHDSSSPEMEHFLSLIHTIFNVGTGVSPDEERSEYRNFKPLSHWIELCQKNDLIWDGQKPLIREGDPTLNSLIILTKPEKIDFAERKEVYRNGVNTYLTGPEWQNVRSAQRYSAFIEHTPFYSFPYFSEIGTFWRVYANSWQAARAHYSFWEVATTEYTLMNTFIGVMNTIEYTIKGIISAPIRWYFTSDAIKEATHIHLIATLPSPPTHPEINVLQHADHTYHLEIPRYKKATQLLQEIALQNGDFSSISGQTMIQIDLIIPAQGETCLPYAKYLYQVSHPYMEGKAIGAFDVPIRHLAELLRDVANSDIKVEYIHDF